VICLLVILVRLSVSVQVIDLEMTHNVLMGTLNPIHSFSVTLTGAAAVAFHAYSYLSPAGTFYIFLYQFDVL